MSHFPCPYLNSEIELTEEREQHIAQSHPDLLPQHRQHMIETIADPDQIRRSSRFANARLFTRWFDSLKGGKYIVVVVVSDNGDNRHWIITAYIARRLSSEGTVEWQRN